jgi:hypothetical protein
MFTCLLASAAFVVLEPLDDELSDESLPPQAAGHAHECSCQDNTDHDAPHRPLLLVFA